MAAAVLALMASTAGASAKSLDGVTLTIASMNDGFSKVLDRAGAEVQGGDRRRPQGSKSWIMATLLDQDHGGLYRRHKGLRPRHHGYRLGRRYAENKYSLDLTDWVKARRRELDLDDIYPVALESLGQYQGRYVAYTFAPMPNVLAYRKDVLEAAGPQVPATMEELGGQRQKVNDPAKKLFGFVANGQKGPAVAQDWMHTTTSSAARSSTRTASGAELRGQHQEPGRLQGALHRGPHRPCAIEYDWGGREESFRQGHGRLHADWSVGAAAYSDPKVSNIVGKVGIAVAPWPRA